jgi:hypothetical protein
MGSSSIPHLVVGRVHPSIVDSITDLWPFLTEIRPTDAALSDVEDLAPEDANRVLFITDQYRLDGYTARTFWEARRES